MNAYILGTKRKSIESFQGALAEFTSPNLDAHALRSAIDHAAITPSHSTQCWRLYRRRRSMSGTCPSNDVPSRTDDSISSATIDKVYGSGMRAIMFANVQIELSRNDYIASGGMEGMTNCPCILPTSRYANGM